MATERQSGLLAGKPPLRPSSISISENPHIMTERRSSRGMSAMSWPEASTSDRSRDMTRPSTVGPGLLRSSRARQDFGKLQDYIAELERQSEARRKEVLALKAESNRSSAEVNRLRRQSAAPPRHGEVFCAKETSVLPAKMRAIVEDNRMLKEKARKFRERWGAAHDEARQLSAENARLRRELKASRDQLRECDVQPEDFAALKAQVQGVGRMEKEMRVLAGDNQVLKHKIASEVTLKVRAEKVRKRREAEVAATVAELRSELASKDTQVKSLTTQLNAEKRKAGRALARGKLKVPAQETTALPAALLPPQPPPPPEFALMLCILNPDEEKRTGPEEASAAKPLPEGADGMACHIQAAVCGKQARDNMAPKAAGAEETHVVKTAGQLSAGMLEAAAKDCAVPVLDISSTEEEDAAVCIQAAFRGRLSRKRAAGEAQGNVSNALLVS